MKLLLFIELLSAVNIMMTWLDDANCKSDPKDAPRKHPK